MHGVGVDDFRRWRRVLTKKQVWQYRCDHCGKRNLSAGHMGRHEKHCTANPERACRVHAYFSQPQLAVTELRMAINTMLPDCGMGKLRELAGNCPACILAALRQSGILKFDPDGPPLELGFDYKSEMQAVWNRVNDEAE